MPGLIPSVQRLSIVLFLALLSNATKAQPAAPAPLKFDKTGAEVGEQLPNLPVYDLDGKPRRLSELWSNRSGVLLLTSSLTCPKSRASYPRAEELARQLGNDLSVEIIYVLEAHPKGDPSPYRGYEDVTAENRRDGILCKQPTTLQERLKLANRFKDRLHVKAPIHVDGMENAVWSALGSGPNMGVLVDSRGLVVARQGWFDAPSMHKAINEFLTHARRDQPKNDRSTADNALGARLKANQMEIWSAISVFRGNDVHSAAALLDRFPELATYTTGITQSTHGQTMLDFAVEGGSIPIIELLLSRAASINAESDLFPSPLHVACKIGNLPVAELLVKRGADVNLKARAGPTPLQEAAIYGHPDVVKFLSKAGAKPNFFSQVATGELDSVRQTLEVDPTRAQRPDGWNRTPLDYAAATGQIAMMNLLFSYGVKDDEPTIEFVSEPAIHWAAQHRQTAAVQLLLDAGDNPNVTGIWGDTLLHIAAARGDSELARIVLRCKPNLQAQSMDGDAPLHVAVRSKSYELAAMLLAAGADPNVKCGPDRRPCAIFRGGDDPGTLQTPLQAAAEICDVRMLAMLLARGAAINARDHAGWTTLHYAVSAGAEQTATERRETVQFLLAHGADVNAKNAEGQTPLDVTNYEELRSLLREQGAKLGTPGDPN